MNCEMVKVVFDQENRVATVSADFLLHLSGPCLVRYSGNGGEVQICQDIEARCGRYKYFALCNSIQSINAIRVALPGFETLRLSFSHSERRWEQMQPPPKRGVRQFHFQCNQKE
jgi:hypothetical protein